MRLASVSVREETIPLARPYTIATGSYDQVTNFVVQVRAGGQTGLGVASPEPDVTGETVAACRSALAEDRLAPLLEGQDTGELAALGDRLSARLARTPAARAAVDMALHDLAAREQGVPLVRYLGGEARGMPTSVTIGIEDVAATLSAAREHLAAGFRVLKIKLGRSLDEDVERLYRVRELSGDAVALRVDANQGYSLEEALALVRRTHMLRIELLEQPMRAGRPEPMAALPADVRQRVAADESLVDEEDARFLAGPPPVCGVFNVKLMKCGGVGPALRIAATANRAGVRLMWGCMDESVIGISAALHAALASPATEYLDLDGSFDLARDPAVGGFALRDGALWPLDGSGLGARLV